MFNLRTFGKDQEEQHLSDNYKIHYYDCEEYEDEKPESKDIPRPYGCIWHIDKNDSWHKIHLIEDNTYFIMNDSGKVYQKLPFKGRVHEVEK